MLLIDAGNTRVKWRSLEDSAVAAEGAGSWEELPDLLQALLRPGDAVCACLPARPEAARRLQAVVAKRGGRLCLPNREPLLERLRPAYDVPERFGLDRLLALRAASETRPGRPLLVIDAGTAITMDALDVSGRHAGGCILPGLSALGEVLAEKAGLPGIAPHALTEEMLDALSDTERALASGLRGLIAGGVTHLAGGLEAGLGGRAEWLLSGGDAATLAVLLGRPTRVCKNLVLDGLALECCC